MTPTSGSRPRTDPSTLRRTSWAAVVLLSGVLLVSACGGDAVDPEDAETGVPLNSPGEADPAATPTDSADPLTGSDP